MGRGPREPDLPVTDDKVRRTVLVAVSVLLVCGGAWIVFLKLPKELWSLEVLNLSGASARPCL